MVARALTGIVPSQAKPFAGFVTDDDSEQAVLAAAQAAGIADPHVAHGDFDDVLKRLRKIASRRRARSSPAAFARSPASSRKPGLFLRRVRASSEKVDGLFR